MEEVCILTSGHFHCYCLALPNVHRDFIVYQIGLLILLLELQSSFFKRWRDGSGAGGHRDRAGLIHPDRWLVRRLEPAHEVVGVVVRRYGNIVDTRLGGPACHAQGRGDGRNHPTRTVGRITTVT